MILMTFPQPPGQIREVLNTLAVIQRGNAAEIEELGDIEHLPRPWDPSSCDAEFRLPLWVWCDQVVGWLNHEYAWRPAGLIPACWPEHPHIARELPALACQRLAADESPAPDAVGLWHRETLPMFLQRMIERLGEGGCRNNKHIEWPAAGRHDESVSDAAQARRAAAFTRDVARPQPTEERAASPGNP